MKTPKSSGAAESSRLERLYFRYYLVLLALLLITNLSDKARAGEDRDALTFMCCSQHESRGNYHQFNPGIGYDWAVTSNKWYVPDTIGAGIYKNSHGDPAAYAGIQYRPLKLGPITGGFLVFCVVGYKDPMCTPPLPTLELQVTNNLGIEVIHIPKVVDAIRFKWRF